MQSEKTDLRKGLEEFYMRYGEFAIEFERLFFTLRRMIIVILKSNGLQDSGLGHKLILNDNADVLLEKFKLVIANESYSDKVVSEMEDLSKYLLNLKAVRNRLIHGMWATSKPFRNDPKEIVLTGIKGKRIKKGEFQEVFAISLEQLKYFNHSILDVGWYINQLIVNIHDGNNLEDFDFGKYSNNIQDYIKKLQVIKLPS